MVCLFCVMPTVSYAGALCENRDLRTFSLYIENDVFAGDDDQYTNGLKLTWSRYGLLKLPDDALVHRWFYPVVRRLGFDAPGAEKALTFSMGQNIYTPRDVESSELIEDDRPYAGVTYIELGFHKKFNHRMHTLGICLGIVGPHSYAEQIQTETHALLNNDEINGWDNQLKDELVFCLIYDYKRKIFEKNINDGLGGDVVANAGGGLGTSQTYLNAGVMTRYGWNVPDDCGNFSIQPATCFNAELREASCHLQKERFGAHFFLSAGSQVVFRNIFLDGNTFRDSHSVEKKPLVGVIMGGFGLIVKKTKTVFAFVFRTKSFDTQPAPEVYGSISFSFQY